jgi:hypothetical protein
VSGETFEASKRARVAGLEDVRVTATPGDPHRGGAGDVMIQFDAFTFAAGGRSRRAQVVWGAAIYHSDHVHVGVSPG